MTEMILEKFYNTDKNTAEYFADTYRTDKNNNFSDVLRTKVDKKEHSTIGDLKNKSKSAIKDNKIANFTNILKKAANEINVENALDLTLSHDISDVVEELENLVTASVEQECEENDTNADVLEGLCIAYSENKTNNDETLTDEVTINTEENNTENFISELSGGIFIKNNLPEADNTQYENTETSEQNIDTEEKEIQKYDIKEEILESKRTSGESVISDDMIEELNIESVNGDTGLADNNSSLNQQSPEEHGIKAMLNHQDAKSFDSNLAKIDVKSPETSGTSSLSPDKIIDQIMKHLDSVKNTSRVNIILNPAALGRVDLQLINTKEGLSAQFTVTTNEARELLMKGLDGLKEALLAHGVGTDNITVKVSEAEETAYNEDWTDQEGSRGGNKEGRQPKKDEEEKGLFEKTIAQNLKSTDGNV